MLKVTIPDNFIPERTYILDVVLGDFLGLEYDIRTDSTIADWTMEIENGHRLIIEDHFFNHVKPADKYYSQKYIPEHVKYVCSRFASEPNIPVIYGGAEPSVRLLTMTGRTPLEKTMICTIDIFAGAFFMLSRWEEYAVKTRDRHDRFPAAEALAVKFDFIDRPVVNEYIEMLWNMLAELGNIQKRKYRRFALYLTHDIDHISLWNNFRDFIKTLGGDIIKRKSLPQAMSNTAHFLKSTFGAAKQPYDTFDYLMTQSEKRRLHSHFFFMTGGGGKDGNHYHPDDPKLIRIIKDIKRRGHTIGFHPGYDSPDDYARWTKEYKKLTALTDSNITEGRQHYLRFRLPDTWRIWDYHDMKFDSTLGYPEREGFRCGVCYDFPVFDIVARKRLNLREMPLIAMDATLVQYRRMPPGRAQSKLHKLIDRVYRYDGTFVLLWHNSSFNLYPWSRYEKVYENTLDYAAERTGDSGQERGRAPASPARKKAVLLTYHCRKSPRQAGFHQLAHALRNEGWETLFLTAPYSLLSQIRNNYRSRCIIPEETNRLHRHGENDYSYVLKTPWHPVNLKNRFLNGIFAPLFRRYDRFLTGEMMDYIRQADLFIFESCAALLFFDKIRKINPKAKMIYRVSDDLKLLNVPPVVLEAEKKSAPLFDLVSSPSAYLHRYFEHFGHASLDHHGLRKDLYDKDYENPYDASCTNVVFIGQAHLDYDFLRRALQICPHWKFHVIGPLSSEHMSENIIYYGEKPFEETIPFIKYADIGLHTLAFRPGAGSFTDSLKVVQYTYCRLPIIAPDFLECDRSNFIYYRPGDSVSIARALETAQKFNHTLIDNDRIPSWDDLVQSWLAKLNIVQTENVESRLYI